MRTEHFEASIHIDGEDAPTTEYQFTETRDDDGTEILTCYIASRMGKGFEVRYTNMSWNPEKALSYSLLVDGNPVHNELDEAEDRHLRLPTSTIISGITSDDGTSLKPFVFSPLQLTDEEMSVQSAGWKEDLGVIGLAIGPCDPHEGGVPVEEPDTSLAPITMNEKIKKGVTQQVLLADALAIPEDRRTESTYGKDYGMDFVQFRFVYRPLDVLRADGIVPAPSPSPGPSDERRLPPDAVTQHNADATDDDADADAREAKQLRERLAALESDEARRIRLQLEAIEARMRSGSGGVKRERGDTIITSSAASRKKVKREGGGGKAEVIDLTLDD
ncbi:hypothetical protein MKEN_00735100 [Mycena kentingensis (nom. inval.)]|nr:hypothetical protein MKEN_00735100 [Mycena kentingensis (nom. inval.)]